MNRLAPVGAGLFFRGKMAIHRGPGPISIRHSAQHAVVKTSIETNKFDTDTD